MRNKNINDEKFEFIKNIFKIIYYNKYINKYNSIFALNLIKWMIMRIRYD